MIQATPRSARRLPLWAALLVLPLLLMAAAHAEPRIETFSLENRSADELIPIIRPLLSEESAVSGAGYTLILRAGAADREQVRALLEELDQAPDRLLVTVRQGVDAAYADSGASVTARVRTDEGELVIGDQPSEGARVKVYRTVREADTGTTQRLQILAGNWARIHTGQAVPLPYRRQQSSPYGSTTEEGIEYRDVLTGFEVRPRLHDDQVTLDIRPFREHSTHSGGAYDVDALVTTIRAPLGQWIELGGSGQNERARENANVYSTRRRERDARTYLKVERLP